MQKLTSFLNRLGISAQRTQEPNPLRQDNTVLAASGRAFNVTEEALHQTEELCRKIFDYSNDAILVSRPSHDKFLDVNPRACTMLGYSRDELLATPLSAIHPTDLAKLGAFAETVFERGLGWTNELTCVTKSGLELPTEISASSIEISGMSCIIALVRDISERKRTEETLRQQMRELAVLEERNRLARELHDSVTQSLYSLTLFAEAGRRSAEAGDLDRVKEYLGQLGETAHQSLKEARLLIHQLRPAVLEQEGLVGALQQRLDAVERRAGVEARLLLDGTIGLPASLEEQLYHVAQEALNNALKHAAATAVTVHLAANAELVELEVEDNGRGFDPKVVSQSGGMGLGNIRKRVEDLGGSLTILSAPGKGTKVKVRVTP